MGEDRGTQPAVEGPGAAGRLARIGPILPGLADQLDGAALGLAGPEITAGRRAAGAAAGAIRGHLLPRLADLDAPAVVVVAGSTGAGKSTLVNSIAGMPISAVGAKRPTTVSPVIVCHPDDLEWFSQRRLLPELTGGGGSAEVDRASVTVAMSPAIPSGLAVIDAPDIDSVAEANHALAEALLSAADVWFWATTPTRYGDRRPLEYLRRAGEHGRPVAVLVNKVDPASAAEVTELLRARLAEAGLGDVPLFTAPRGLTDQAMLPDDVMAPVRAWIAEAGSPERRRAAIAQALEASISGLSADLDLTLVGLRAERAAADRLAGDVDAAFSAARERIRSSLEDGSLLRGEVARQLPEALGTGRYLRQLERTVDEVRRKAMDQMSAATQRNLRNAADASRDFIGSLFDFRREGPESPKQAERSVTRIGQAAAQSLLEVVVTQAGQATGEAAAAWRAEPAAAPLDPRLGDLSRAAPDFRDRVEAEVTAWRADLVVLVRDLGLPRLKTARVLSGGINVLAGALMLVVFAGTGGALLGAEVVVAGGSAALMHRLLVYVLGKQTVAQLARQAREQLDERIDRLIAGERARFAAVLDSVVSPADLAERLDRARAELASR